MGGGGGGGGAGLSIYKWGWGGGGGTELVRQRKRDKHEGKKQNMKRVTWCVSMNAFYTRTGTTVRYGFIPAAIQSPNLQTFQGPRNRLQGKDSAGLGIDSWAP